MNKTFVFTLLLLLLGITVLHADVQQRFPKPDFESGYERPQMQTPAPRSLALEYLDVAVLAAALALSVYFAHKRRSRRALFLLMIFSMIYFGFWRKGCVCSVGSVQNVALALFSHDYVIPLTVVLFFLLPLIFTLFYGRTFCSSVCPLGAVQDAVILKPVSVPAPLRHILGLLPYLYLGFGVLFASVGAGFIVCRYDPFVGFFRFSGSFHMIFLGLFMLLLGTVVARPYCRFLCPYGVLLNWMSRLARKHVRITPSLCINCRLCEASCPFDAIHKAEPAPPKPPTMRLLTLLVLTPVIMAAAGWAISSMNVPLSRLHPTVSLAEEIAMEDNGLRTETTVETRTFRATGKPTAALFAEAREIQRKVRRGGWLLGAFLGLVFSLKVMNLYVIRRRDEYDVDHGECLSCARCFRYCPVDKDGKTIFPVELKTN